MQILAQLTFGLDKLDIFLSEYNRPPEWQGRVRVSNQHPLHLKSMFWKIGIHNATDTGNKHNTSKNSEQAHNIR